MSHILSQEDDLEGARAAAREGISLIIPMAMELPQAFQQLVMNLGRVYVDYSKRGKLGPEPESMRLLNDFAAKLNALDEAQEEDPRKEQS